MKLCPGLAEVIFVMLFKYILPSFSFAMIDQKPVCVVDVCFWVYFCTVVCHCVHRLCFVVHLHAVDWVLVNASHPTARWGSSPPE